MPNMNLFMYRSASAEADTRGIKKGILRKIHRKTPVSESLFNKVPDGCASASVCPYL